MLDISDTGYEGKFDFAWCGQRPDISYMLATVPRTGSTWFSHLLWQTGCLGALFYPLFLLLVFGLVAGAGILGELAGGGAAGLGIGLAGWALAIGLTAAVVWLSLLLGSRGLERIEV